MRLLRWLLVLLMVVGLSLTLFGADKANAQGYPQVAELQPFTAEAQYMSLPGYLRWQVFVEQGTWISRMEAAEAVQDQLMGM